ncbi:MAG: hypothetical protein FWF76_02560 [Oscillospiraceae bacterium]|nr:hypothetical protein [Oscillospiraceae bacterium]
MTPYVSVTTMNIGGREFILAEVARGMGKLGTFRYATTTNTATDVFFIEQEPILNIFNPNTANDNVNKYIHQISSPEKESDPVIARFSAAIDNYYLYEQGLARSVLPVLEMLNPGLYVVHEAQIHPTDGAGKYFWTAYPTQRPVLGSANKNAVINENNFTPSFLMPTRQPYDFRSAKMLSREEEYRKGKPFAGLSYHVTGMFSALLDGHHAATAALHNDVSFRSLMIEPLTGIMYNNHENLGLSGSGKGASFHDEKRKIVALTCPFVNIPLEELPDDSLERFLLARKNVKPTAFSEIKPKMNKLARSISKRAIPIAVYDKASQLPTTNMAEAASAVDTISNEQLDALIAGQVKYDDEYIISSNLNSSIDIACNHLQVNDFERFLKFAISILQNVELLTIHKFVAERLFAVIHPSIYEYFQTCYEEGLSKFGVIATEFDSVSGDNSEPTPEENKAKIVFEVARKYMTKWDEHLEKRRIAEDSYNLKRTKQDKNKKKITEGKGIATLEAAVRGIGGMAKKPS